MSESLERAVADLRADIARLESRIRLLERQEVRFGGSLVGRTTLGKKAASPQVSEAVLPPPFAAPVSSAQVPPALPGPQGHGLLASAPPPPSALPGPPPPPPMRIEVNSEAAPIAQAMSPTAPPPPAQTTAVPPPPAHRPPGASPVAASSEEDLESRMGLTWINRIGAITLILAVGFVFVYAADNGWIGPEVRVLIGMLAGGLFCGGAEWLVRRGHRVVAQGVAGVGISIFYFALYAAFQVFELLPQLPVFGLMATVTVFGGFLAVRYQSQALAALAAVGGFLTPVMLSTGDNRVWELNAYLLILASGAIFLSVKQRWQGLAWVAYLGVKILYWGSVIEDEGKTAGYPSLVFGVLYYALFLSTPWRGIAAVAQISFGFAMLTGGAWAKISEWTWQLLVPLAAGVAVATVRKRTVEAVAAMFTAHAAAALGLLMMLDVGGDVLIPKDAVGMAILASIWALFAAWLVAGWLRLPKGNPDTAAAMFALNSLAFAAEGIALIEAVGWEAKGTFAFAIAALHLAVGLPGLGSILSAERFPTVGRMAQLLGVFFLACAIPLQLDGTVIAAIWAGMGLALAIASSRERAIWMAVAAYSLFISAFIRLVAFDFPDLTLDPPPFAHGVFLISILCGAAMLGAAWAWRGISHRWAAAFLGHFTMLMTLIVEAVRWAERSAPEGQVLIFQTTAISVLLGIYAAILVALGVVTRTRPNRVAGLALLMIVVAKLYLYDVWLLETLYRIVAFGALGSMLLATSFLYSRLRHTVRQLLSEEPGTPTPPRPEPEAAPPPTSPTPPV